MTTLSQARSAPPLHTLRYLSAGLAACLALLVALVAGTGWLYLLRDVRELAVGPHLKGALPLQQLAGADAQPLVRMAAAWLTTGIALGIALATVTRLRRSARALFTAVVSAVLLVATAAASDAIARNETVGYNLHGALSQAGVWVAAALLAVGVLLAPPWSRWREGDQWRSGRARR